MALLNYLHGLVVQHQFKQRDYAVFGELRRDCPALHAWKLLFGVPNILRSLDHAYLVLPTFGLHGNDVMTTALVDADVEFIDFDLSYALYRRAQMVLQTVCGQSEECVYQPVISDNRQQRLFVGALSVPVLCRVFRRIA
jgi:hypothetical protein